MTSHRRTAARRSRRARAALCAATALAAALLALAGCRAPTGPAPAVPPPAPVPLDRLPGFTADDLSGLAVALDQQCAAPRPPGDWAALCASRQGQPLEAWLRSRFVARELVDAEQPDGLITGYYEPLLTGSLVREHAGQVPLRARPADLLTIELAEVEPRLKGLRLRGRLDGQRVVPYYSRAQTEARERSAGGATRPAAGATGATGAKGAGAPAAGAAAPVTGDVLAGADDPVDAFVLEIQGSGRIRLRDGTQMRIGYADQNGHPYHPIGRTLIERGALDRDAVTGPSIRAWLATHPAQAPDVMRSNPSLVYFRTLPPPADPSLGPPGSLGVPLTPLRSIAVDRSRIPLGSLVYLASTDPVSGAPLQRLMVAQDTGGAIRGLKRADVFWGFGPEAGRAAGLMKAPARMWVLEPR